MRRKLLIPSLIVLLLLTPTSLGAAEGGVDVNPDENAPFTVISRDSPSVDKEKWSLTIEMSQDAYDNGTSFELITQICTNDGICDPPVTMNADIDQRLHSISLTLLTTTLTSTGVSKQQIQKATKPITHKAIGSKPGHLATIMKGSGGTDSLDDGCSSDGETTPGISIIATIAVVSIAGLIINRQQTYQK